jgi:hypothetical protein
MDLFDILIIFLVILIVILLFKRTSEKYDGLSYVDDMDYQNCCKLYGCNSFNCQYFLNQRQAPYVLVGAVMYNKNNIYSLYQRYNVDTKLYEYYYLDKQDKNNQIFIKIDTDGSQLMNNDKLKINNLEYKVYIHNMNSQIMNNYDYYNYFNTYPRFNVYDNVYTNKVIKPIVGPGGLLQSIDGKNKYILLEQVLNPKHHEYSYLVNIDGNLLPINRNKKLTDGEIVNVPGLEENYKFVEDNRVPIIY